MPSTRPEAPLWEPSRERADACRLTEFARWVDEHHGTDLATYEELWQWSVENLEVFWASIWDYFEVQSSSPYAAVLDGERMPDVRWFPGARLNWAEHALRHDGGSETALIALTDGGHREEVSWDELRRRVAALAASLRELGVGPGDRVAAILPNNAQAVVALLATASIGAVWACAAPELGTNAVLSRLSQLEPSVLLLGDGYSYGGTWVDRRPLAIAVRRALPATRHVVLVPHAFPDEPPPEELADALAWESLVGGVHELRFEPVAFDHPLWVLFTSGTTGIPKGIVHGHGGILLEEFKTHALMFDLRPGDRMLFTASTSWVVWNLLVTVLQVGATPVLFDGNPSHPGAHTLWRIAEDERLRVLGFGSAFVGVCQKAGLVPGDRFDLSGLDLVLATGSPLPIDGWHWIYESVSKDVRLSSVSGGTEVCTAFVGGAELVPVHATELGPAWLGVDVQAWGAEGLPVVGEVAELVVTTPMPSMPTSFWNDPGGLRYRETYFDSWAGVWRHGDWCTKTDRGTFVIHGRSDATINRHGVRMGTAEIYEVVNRIPQVTESLVVGIELADGRYYMPLFLTLAPGTELDSELRHLVASTLRQEVSPRAVPDEIVPVPRIPHTVTGKRLEVPVKRLLLGEPLECVINVDAVDSPEAVRWFADFARSRAEP